MFSGCCIGYSPCFLVVVLVTLHVFWLLSCLHSMFPGCLGYSPCLKAIEQHAFHINLYKVSLFTLVKLQQLVIYNVCTQSLSRPVRKS